MMPPWNIGKAEDIKRRLAELDTARKPPPERKVGEWPHAMDVARDLAKQGNAVAVQLGHRLSDWMLEGARWKATCMNCRALAYARPRSFNGAPLSGEALTFACPRK